jgi:hypothetical protein
MLPDTIPSQLLPALCQAKIRLHYPKNIWTNQSIIVASAFRFMMAALQKLSRSIVSLFPIYFFRYMFNPSQLPL